MDDEKIRSLLVKSSSHYTLMELAYNGTITGEVDRFKEYVHPNEVCDEIEKKSKELEERIRVLKHGK